MSKEDEIKKSEKQIVGKQKNSRLDIFKIIFDFAVIIVMAVGLFVAIMANKTSRQANELTRDLINQTQKSLQINHKALELQKTGFELRNRPYLGILDYNFSNKEVADLQGKKWPCCIEFKLRNISEIPANNINISSKVYLNGKSIRKINFIPVALSKGVTKPVIIGLPDYIYANANDKENKIEIKTILTYSGMLNQGKIKYKTDETVYYSPTENVFKITEQKYQ